jgi:integrase
LFAVVAGPDHLAIRILVQLGLRSEELFALRRNDALDAELVIDEAVVNGPTKEPKTLASASRVHVPADLAIELKHYLETIDANPAAWLFPSTRKGIPARPGNFLRRVLKPAAIQAGIALSKDAAGEDTTALNFQSLRRTSATLFGARAKDPKSTQAHMRHADPALEQQRKRQAQLQHEAANVRPV